MVVAEAAQPRYTGVMLHLFPAILALSCCASDGGPPAIDDTAEETHLLENLSLGAAYRLEGRRSLFRVRVVGRAGPDGDQFYWCVDAPVEDGGLLALPDEGLAGELTVEAVLEVQYVPPKVGVRPGCLRYRLEKAVRRL
jgi:hypothetical protein